MTFFIVVGVLIGAGLSLYGAMTVRQADATLLGRLNRHNLKPSRSLVELELQMPRVERILNPVRRRLARFVRQFTPGGTIEKIQERLAQAGNPRNLTVQDFLGAKGMAAVALAGLAFLAMTFVLHPSFTKFVLFLAVSAVLGFFLPDLWVRQLIKRRQAEIQRYLADAIDILAISVEAGQGFDGALSTLSSRKQNALTYEFDRFRLEVQAGKSRREAFRDLALRTGVEDLLQFVAAMIQADQLGIGVSQVLKSQSDELRVKRRQRAEEKARQAPIKML
ncbi:MAG TPA: type II secretion system F family protein, partial [Chloroflexota bacterium]|nr:type II secretion system F family protein [Chloroflexota bacterium]